jgi:DNA-directed RNA polymerase sigma subunit (sigma70/sigma32)
MPDKWCSLAVLRLKAMRNAEKEPSQEEEDVMPGCPWAIDHQMSNYCFFKFMDEYAGDKPLSDVEIASLNNISIDTVKKTEKTALAKMKEHETLTKLNAGDGKPVVEEKDDSSYSVVK